MAISHLDTVCSVFLFMCFVNTPIFCQPQFMDVTEQAGIDHFFEVFQGTFGGGAVVIDYDRDGWEDLFISGGQGENQLLRNQGDGTFGNTASQAGLEILTGRVTQGAATADVNKDGWPDLFIATIANISGEGFAQAANVLLINNGDGTFSDHSVSFGLTEETFSTSASFGDVNQDGYPDLYVCNYFDQYAGDLDAFNGPQTSGDIRPGRDLFYINNGGTSFTESSAQYGIQRVGLTFQALWSDYDNDGDLDVLVANDFGNRSTPNLLYRNDYPKATFSEVGDANDFDFGINAMGIGACDVNNDGWLDYKITNIQVSPFLINGGQEGGFSEQSEERGTGFSTVRVNGGFRITPVSWGVNFFDVDNDMDSDLYITNGCLNPQLTPNPNLMLENIGGTFYEKGFISRTNDHSIGRGSVVLDYDHDGDLDLLVVNQIPYRDEDVGVTFTGTRLFRNENNYQNNWIKVQLVGKESETSGIGSRIEANVSGVKLIREIYGGSSHESQNSTIAHFGLGNHWGLDSLVIKWSSGNRQVITDVPANQTLLITEEIPRNTTAENLGTLALYPNSFSDQVAVSYQLSNFTAFSLTVADANGRHLYELANAREGRKGIFNWQVPKSMVPGMYLFSLHTPEGTIMSKGVKN